VEWPMSGRLQLGRGARHSHDGNMKVLLPQ
jgi:hypothetical protein